ncbi:MAG: acyl carrier protein [Gammaproteobacteria bacterium]|nr:MAG: acyl carrier protein [Gammaproteobacteria bacterium]
MVTLQDISQIIGEVLQLGSNADNFDSDTPLLGSVPEFDSMAVVSVLTAVEDNYGIAIDDDEVSAEIFETVGSFLEFVKEKAGG